MLSSHFSPGLAPQVGQRMDRIFFSVTFITHICTGCWTKLVNSDHSEAGRVFFAAWCSPPLLSTTLIMVGVGRQTGIVGTSVFPDACSVTDRSTDEACIVHGKLNLSVPGPDRYCHSLRCRVRRYRFTSAMTQPAKNITVTSTAT